MCVNVSIPSRRVGDKLSQVLLSPSASRFPSPQGGSETSLWRPAQTSRVTVSIPSRRVGDSILGSTDVAVDDVSIPSRRVGDHPTGFGEVPLTASFHPLKAGRRPATALSGRAAAVVSPTRLEGMETFASDFSFLSFQRLRPALRGWKRQKSYFRRRN